MLEARDIEELPERVLCAFRLHHVHLDEINHMDVTEHSVKDEPDGSGMDEGYSDTWLREMQVEYVAVHETLLPRKFLQCSSAVFFKNYYPPMKRKICTFEFILINQID